jgi:hypothetical protein
VVKTALDPSAFDQAWEEGRRMTLTEALDQAQVV